MIWPWGLLLGGVFGTIVKSFVTDILMPPTGPFLGGVDFTDLFLILKDGMLAGPYATLLSAQEAGAVTIGYGIFINVVVSFLIVACAVFFLIKGINTLKRDEPKLPEVPVTKECLFCFSSIAIKATRCQLCTSEIK